MGVFDLLWGGADYEPKNWSEAAYKRAYWGWADYETKDWSNAPYKREHSARRSSVAYGWFRQRSLTGSRYLHVFHAE